MGAAEMSRRVPPSPDMGWMRATGESVGSTQRQLRENDD
jgi:hypothetical protein